MKKYLKPAVSALSFKVYERIAIDHCDGTFYPEGGGEYRWHLEGPSLLDLAATKNPNCVLTILDGLSS